MKFVNLTRPSGKMIALNPNWVSAVQHDDNKDLTKIEIGSGLYFWVKEAVDDVIARCESNADH